MSDLTSERIAELRKVAEAATQGEWEARKTKIFGVPCDRQYIVVGTEHFSIAKLTGSEGYEGITPDAAHIAAFDPPTVLSLLDALTAERERAEKAELRLQRIDEGSEEAQREAEEIMREGLVFKAERDALRAQVERLRSAVGEVSELLRERNEDDGPIFVTVRAALAGSEGKP